MDFIELTLIIISVSIVIFVELLETNPPPIFGVYQRRNGFYWLKVAFIYCLLSVKKFRSSLKRHELTSNLEKPQQLSHEQAAETIYMSGSNKDGDHLTVRLETTKDCIDGQLYLKINSSDMGIIGTTYMSDNISPRPEKNCFEFSAGGIKLLPLRPLKEWRLIYKGNMSKKHNLIAEHHVKIDGVWTSKKPYFYSNGDMDTMLTSKCLAHEKFNKTYFENMKILHEAHSEQFGTLKLNITVDKKCYEIELDAVKKCSFGDYKDWSQYHRYGIHYFATENGDCFSFGEICLPITASRLSFGHVYSARDKKIYPIKDTSFKLHQYGGINGPPEDYGFTLAAGDQNYAVHVRVVESPYFYIGKERQAKIYERFSMFEVNGLKGWGTSQWLYRNIEKEGRH